MTANLGFSLFLFAIAAAMAMITWRMLKADKENAKLSLASLSWTTVPGLVGSAIVASTGSGDFEEASWYEPRVNYTYTIAGREYAGARISFGRMQFSSKKKADAVIAKYPAGATVSIAYDPQDPQNSVLDRATRPPAVSFWTGFAGVMTVIVALLGVGMLFLSF